MATDHDDWIGLGGTLWRYRDYVREVYSQPDDDFAEHWERTALEIAQSDDTEFVAANQVCFLTRGCKHDDRHRLQRLIGFDDPKHLQTVHLGELEIDCLAVGDGDFYHTEP